jgi:hypothetical protein
MPELDFAAELGIDLATKDDVMSMFDRLDRKKMDVGKYRQQIFAADSRITTAAGACGFRVYDVPDGMQFYPSRYIIWSDAHNPSTGGCFQSATCYGGIYHGIASPVNLADYFPPPSGGISESATPNIIPYYKEFNRHDSPEFQAPDNVFFGLVNGPVTTNVTCLLYGWLEELREGNLQLKRHRGKMRRHPSQAIKRSAVGDRTEDATLG